LQFDKTEIVIRQRTVLELLDLSLLLLRRYWRQLLASSAILGIPLLIVDVLLLHWMLSDTGLEAAAEMDNPAAAAQQRFAYHLAALFFLQFPLASLPATVLLGHEIFYQRLSLRGLIALLRPSLPAAVLVLGITRMGLLGIPLEFMVDPYVPFDPLWELLMLAGVCCGWSGLCRAFAPYAPEILSLEACRLRPATGGEISYRKRSRLLHSAISGESFTRFGVLALVIPALVLILYSLVFVVDFAGLRHGRSQAFNALISNQVLIQVVFPAALWFSGIYATVFRFLSYLDCRIRLEGWEVDLRLKAERDRWRAKQRIATPEVVLEATVL